MKKVLITGAGTGFGHEVALRLALKGDRQADGKARQGSNRGGVVSRRPER